MIKANLKRKDIQGMELFWQYLEEAERKCQYCPERWDKALELPISIFNTQMTSELPRQTSKT
uniref:Uncharacterized protein n=1 Tax=Romanomermis culicivorax TaxID=13658 RepID=A0A915KRL6_ROMCU